MHRWEEHTRPFAYHDLLRRYTSRTPITPRAGSSAHVQVPTSCYFFLLFFSHTLHRSLSKYNLDTLISSLSPNPTRQFCMWTLLLSAPAFPETAVKQDMFAVLEDVNDGVCLCRLPLHYTKPETSTAA
jgi:hypothetical protein